MMDMFNSGHGWGMSGGMWFLSILFWVLVIAGIIFIARGFVGSKDKLVTPPSSDSPLTILQKRFAKGDIDEETFKRMKQELEDQGP